MINEKYFIFASTKNEMNLHEIKPVKNINFGPICKPSSGGFWSSEYYEDIISEWYQFLIDGLGCNEDDIKYVTKFKLNKDAKVFTIDNEEDFNRIISLYKMSMDNLHPVLISLYDYGIIDYEKLAQDYDALYLTSNGARECYFHLYGYDVNTLLVFNKDCIDKDSIERIK